MTKRYDRAYFDKWYRSKTHRVHAEGELRRKVHLAVSIAEYFLQREIRSVLDIGAGEGAWYRELRSLRRTIRYTGVDPSDYVVRRFGKTRSIRRGGFGDLPNLVLPRNFDLVICSDVLHYVPERDIKAGLPAMAKLTGCLAYIEVLTAEDDIVGDLEGLVQRPALWYQRLFERVGLTHVGPYCWLSASTRDMASSLELPR